MTVQVGASLKSFETVYVHKLRSMSVLYNIFQTRDVNTSWAHQGTEIQRVCKISVINVWTFRLTYVTEFM